MNTFQIKASVHTHAAAAEVCHLKGSRAARGHPRRRRERLRIAGRPRSTYCGIHFSGVNTPLLKSVIAAADYFIVAGARSTGGDKYLKKGEEVGEGGFHDAAENSRCHDVHSKEVPFR